MIVSGGHGHRHDVGIESVGDALQSIGLKYGGLNMTSYIVHSFQNGEVRPRLTRVCRKASHPFDGALTISIRGQLQGSSGGEISGPNDHIVWPRLELRVESDEGPSHDRE